MAVRSLLLIAAAAALVRAQPDDSANDGDDLVAFTPESDVFKAGAAGSRQTTLVALVRPASSPFSAEFHPVLHAIKAQLADLGLPRSVGYVDLDDPLAVRISKTYAIRTVPSVLLFLEHAPNPVRLDYMPNKTAEEYVHEVLHFALRSRPLHALPGLPPLDMRALAGNVTAEDEARMEAAMKAQAAAQEQQQQAQVAVAAGSGEAAAAPAAAAADGSSNATLAAGDANATAPAPGSNSADGSDEESAPPPTPLESSLAAFITTIDRQLELVEVLRHRLVRARQAAEEAAKAGTGPAVQLYNSRRAHLLTAGEMVDRPELLAAVEDMGTLGELLPKAY